MCSQGSGGSSSITWELRKCECRPALLVAVGLAEPESHWRGHLLLRLVVTVPGRSAAGLDDRELRELLPLSQAPCFWAPRQWCRECPCSKDDQSEPLSWDLETGCHFLEGQGLTSGQEHCWAGGWGESTIFSTCRNS